MAEGADRTLWESEVCGRLHLPVVSCLFSGSHWRGHQRAGRDPGGAGL